MTAITVSFVAKVATDWDPDAPLTTGKLNALYDNTEYLKQWLGQSYTAGAAQDHNHDGVNSAVVETGPNLLKNGSFESGTSGWTLTDYSGGSHAISASQHAHGKQSLAITSTVLANGGGNALSAAFIEIGSDEFYQWESWIWASVANVSGKLEVNWYDNAQALISTSVLYTSNNLPTTKTLNTGIIKAPNTARYVKYKMTGGIPASGSATGTVYFDGQRLGDFAGIGGSLKYLANDTWVCPAGVDTVYITAISGGGGGGGGNGASGGGGGGGGGSGGLLIATLIAVTPGSSYTVTIGGGGAAGGVNAGGGTGGTTSFGSALSIPGGGGGYGFGAGAGGGAAGGGGNGSFAGSAGSAGVSGVGGGDGGGPGGATANSGAGTANTGGGGGGGYGNAGGGAGGSGFLIVGW